MSSAPPSIPPVCSILLLALSDDLLVDVLNPPVSCIHVEQDF